MGGGATHALGEVGIGGLNVGVALRGCFWRGAGVRDAPTRSEMVLRRGVIVAPSGGPLARAPRGDYIAALGGGALLGEGGDRGGYAEVLNIAAGLRKSLWDDGSGGSGPAPSRSISRRGSGRNIKKIICVSHLGTLGKARLTRQGVTLRSVPANRRRRNIDLP